MSICFIKHIKTVNQDHRPQAVKTRLVQVPSTIRENGVVDSALLIIHSPQVIVRCVDCLRIKEDRKSGHKGERHKDSV
jgi:hypothetical protein